MHRGRQRKGEPVSSSYPFDIPTQAFSFNLFKQAFAAVQVRGGSWGGFSW
jgi:hypothetical protein